MAYRVVIVQYNKSWPVLYEKEHQYIRQQAGQYCLALEHVGSTAIPGMCAKPIIDIMLGIEHLSDAPLFIESLAEIGYVYRPEFERFIPERRFFEKGVRQDYYHLHLVELSSNFWKDHILFRDFLRENPDIAKKYGELKQRLVQNFADDRFGYTDSKTSFIHSVINKAREQNSTQTT